MAEAVRPIFFGTQRGGRVSVRGKKKCERNELFFWPHRPRPPRLSLPPPKPRAKPTPTHTHTTPTPTPTQPAATATRTTPAISPLPHRFKRSRPFQAILVFAHCLHQLGRPGPIHTLRLPSMPRCITVKPASMPSTTPTVCPPSPPSSRRRRDEATRWSCRCPGTARHLSAALGSLCPVGGAGGTRPACSAATDEARAAAAIARW